MGILLDQPRLKHSRHHSQEERFLRERKQPFSTFNSDKYWTQSWVTVAPDLSRSVHSNLNWGECIIFRLETLTKNVFLRRVEIEVKGFVPLWILTVGFNCRSLCFGMWRFHYLQWHVRVGRVNYETNVPLERESVEGTTRTQERERKNVSGLSFIRS